MVMLSLYASLLQRYGAGDDVGVGHPVAGRWRREDNNAVGLFANTAVCRCDLSGDPSFREVLARTRSAYLADQRHHRLPFDEVVAAVSPARVSGQNVLFQHMLVALNVRGAELALDGLEVEELTVDPGTRQVDLELEMTDRDEELRAHPHVCDRPVRGGASRALPPASRPVGSRSRRPA